MPESFYRTDPRKESKGMADQINELRKQLAAKEKAFLDYLKALAESLGLDSDTEGCVNPELALAARIQLKIMPLQLAEDRGAKANL